MDPSTDPRTDDILAIVAKEAMVDRDKLVLDARIDTLGISSLDMTQAIFGIEEKYDVEIPVVAEQAGQEFATVGNLVEHALRAIDAKRAAPAAG